jgi:hypothetical protein
LRPDIDHLATFPQTKQPAVELTSGAEHERFDFAPDLFLDNLTSKPGQRQPRVNATPTGDDPTHPDRLDPE